MIVSEKLSSCTNLIHGFTTRKEGDFRNLKETLKREMTQSQTAVYLCVKAYGGFKQAEFVLSQQIHDGKIALVERRDKGKVIKGADGLITCKKGVVLAVTTADCLPILFYEPEQKIVGIVHAGWRGSLQRIAQKMVKKVKDLGGSLKKTVVAIGPHIKVCCYDIDKKRVWMFKKEFGRKVIIKRGDKFFLDLIRANFIQLLEGGIEEKNIEISPFCTKCNHDLFFSYRKNRKNYGEMLSFIGIVKKNN